MRKLTIIVLLTTLVLSVLPFVNSATYVVDDEYHWACLTHGDKLVTYSCDHDCCRVCQKNGYTYPENRCSGSPCSCEGAHAGDLEDPVITLTLPVDNFVSGTRSVDFMLDVDEDVSLYYKDSADERRGFRKLCSSCKKFDDKISFVDGPHTITLQAVDYNSNDAEETVSFFVDSRKPRIKKILPKAKGYTNGTFIVEYDEDNLEKITLVYDQGFGPVSVVRENCPSGAKQQCTFFVPGMSNLPLNYSFIVEDVISTVQSKEVKAVNVDTEVPVMSVIEPYITTYGTNTYSGSVLFDVDVSEEITLEYLDYVEGSTRIPKWYKLCSKCDNYYKKRYLAKGNHNMIIRATDLAGNSDQSSVSFTVV